MVDEPGQPFSSKKKDNTAHVSIGLEVAQD
jgi:hypothetical protein